MSKRLDELEWKADCLQSRMDALSRADAEGDVDVERIVKRLLPGADASEVRKVTQRVEGKLTRGGRPGEVDATALVTEYLGEERTRKRYGDAAVADAQGDVKIKSNIFDGTKYVPLEAREASEHGIFDIFLDGKLMVGGLPFGSVYSKMKEIEKRESKPVPKKAVPAGGGYRSEMSVFFPRTRR